MLRRISPLRLLLLAVLLEFSATSSAEYRPDLHSVKQLRMKGIERQTLDFSCGAAVLSMLLEKYFQDSYSEAALISDIVYRLSDDEIKNRLRDGFSMLDLKKLAIRLGYSAVGVHLVKSALQSLPGPVIVLLRDDTVNHFVVIKAVSSGYVYIADPSRGNIRIPLHELDKLWDGETLILGRENFGLPVAHALSVSSRKQMFMEKEMARTLLNQPARLAGSK